MALIGRNGILKSWQQDGTICAFALPFSWNENKTQIETKTGKAARVYQIRIAVAMVYSVIAAVQVANTWTTSSRQVAMHSIIFLTAFFDSITQHGLIWRSKTDAVWLANNLLKFEKQVSHSEKFEETKTGITSAFFIRILIHSEILTGLSMPFLYHFDMFRNPCYPMYAGYWLNDQCSNVEVGTSNPAQGSFSEIAIKVAVALTSFINWTFLYIGFCYYIGIEFLLHGFYFRAAIEHVGG